jgi:hypothetical protein
VNWSGGQAQSWLLECVSRRCRGCRALGEEIDEIGTCRTFRSIGSALYASEAILELVLGGVKLRKRRRQMFELFIELLLHLSELLGL